MMSLVLQDCRRAFQRRLQDRLHMVASVALAASAAMVLSVAHTAQMADHLHIRNFILRTAPGIWMIFSQCSEICFHMVAAPEVVARTAQVVQGLRWKQCRLEQLHRWFSAGTFIEPQGF